MALEQAIAYALELPSEPAPTAQPAPMPPARPPLESQATHPAGLTEREVEVLRLLAQGLSYDQIADELIISPRTVNRHLTAIYGKLDVTSRHAATRWAMEQGLA